MNNELRPNLKYEIFSIDTNMYRIGSQINMDQPLHAGNVHFVTGILKTQEEAEEKLASLLV